MSVLKNVMKMPADKLDGEIKHLRQTIEAYRQKMTKIEEDMAYYELIMNPPPDKKRKLDLISADEKKIEGKILQVKTDKVNLDKQLREFEKELLEIDYRNCLALFDTHQMADIVDNHTGVVRFQRCDRCGFTSR